MNGAKDYQRATGGNLWFDTLDQADKDRNPLDRSKEVDVAIVGAGYSGLWTAYYLHSLRPNLKIAIIEAESVGFGASGRNGGWVSSVAYGIDKHLDSEGRNTDGHTLQKSMIDTVDEIERVVNGEKIDCHFRKGGCIKFATNRGQESRLRTEARKWREWGLDESDCLWLDGDDVAKHIRPKHVSEACSVDNVLWFIQQG